MYYKIAVEMRNDIQGVVFDGYSRRGFGALEHDFRLLQANAKSEDLKSMIR